MAAAQVHNGRAHAIMTAPNKRRLQSLSQCCLRFWPRLVNLEIAILPFTSHAGQGVKEWRNFPNFVPQMWKGEKLCAVPVESKLSADGEQLYTDFTSDMDSASLQSNLCKLYDWSGKLRLNFASWMLYYQCWWKNNNLSTSQTKRKSFVYKLRVMSYQSKYSWIGVGFRS